MKKLLILLAFITLLTACHEDMGFDDLQTYSKTGAPHFVVVDPAGSVEKFQFDSKINKFKVKTTNRVNEKVDFMPFPANFGFFPSTHSDSIDKGDLLHGFLIAQSFSIQSIIEVKPIGVASIMLDGKESDIIFSVPAEKRHRIEIATTDSVPEEMQSIFELWFKNAYKVDSVLGWHDSKYAVELIKNRSKR